ncbi:hypothetical protein M8997_018920 [Phyllobacterium sp. 21LDTY02-6]|jgi:hypothetical protein|uniref:hypothetical protein n=1 Tax=unclassified Phyllobacterium TaxID=2638441 RepID=UPI0020210B06|nr:MULTISPECIES: hypothetical protein [unclassified Phyllobacterium]MCO4319263.1 hypothetical protein [Phyllobacterium sp. 21LDTY02-6]MCX8279974.1 hypothetical protein [Phyllobacterium sp. 0TCS1.6C]MCX8296141.1 hypothetical protein [Phyllobacterium sp. 0TCS1.6A]
MERLKAVIADYEIIVQRLESGTDKAYRTSRTGVKEDVSAQTADHYRRLISHYTLIVTRYEEKQAKNRVK